jgi:5-methylcytosine-specific restriction endonuclease McrA
MNMKLNGSLSALSHSRLLDRFVDLVHRDRRCTAEMLGVIAEVDQRKLWAAHACPSMFAFCVEHFHMSEAVAAKRIRAARTARRFPVIFGMVARGELHLSALHQLAKHLTETNHRSVLERAKHKSSREIDLLVAEIAPRPDVASRVRALPRQPAARSANSLTSLGSGTSPDHAMSDDTASAAPTPPASNARKNIKPIVALSPRRYKVEITIDQTTHDKLRMLEDLSANQVLSADPADIVSRALDLLLTYTLKKKAALTDKPRERVANDGGQQSVTRSRSIPAAIRRGVWQRDTGRCAFVDEQGRRCPATRAVEYHHIVPYGRGGQHELDNITLRCQAHNQFQADLDFGRGFMNGMRQSEQAARPVETERGVAP